VWQVITAPHNEAGRFQPVAQAGWQLKSETTFHSVASCSSFLTEAYSAASRSDFLHLYDAMRRAAASLSFRNLGHQELAQLGVSFRCCKQNSGTTYR